VRVGFVLPESYDVGDNLALRHAAAQGSLGVGPVALGLAEVAGVGVCGLGRVIRFYDLRHAHASLLIAEGVHPKKIAERLGHASIKLTMDTYGHLFDGSDRESAERMESGCSASEQTNGILTRTRTSSGSTERERVLLRRARLICC
jgi:hypothetical protein